MGESAWGGGGSEAGGRGCCPNPRRWHTQAPHPYGSFLIMQGPTPFPSLKRYFRNFGKWGRLSLTLPQSWLQQETPDLRPSRPTPPWLMAAFAGGVWGSSSSPQKPSGSIWLYSSPPEASPVPLQAPQLPLTTPQCAWWTGQCQDQEASWW